MKIFSLTNFRRLTKNLNWCIALFFAILLGFGFAWNQLVGVGRGGGPTATSNLDRTVLKIDDIPVSQLEYERAVQAQGQAVAPGPPFVQAQAAAIARLVQNTALQELAKKYHVQVTSTDVDRYIDQLRVEAGQQKASDSAWENFVEQNMGMTLADLRRQLAKSPQLLAQALIAYFKRQQHITPQDAQNQYAQVNLLTVFVPIGNSPVSPAKPGQKPLTDAEAQKLANELLAQAKAGAAQKALAKSDPRVRVVQTGFRSEYSPMPGMMSDNSPFGVLGYGKDFDAAVHATPVNGFTPVIKTNGLFSGYIFAKVLARKIALPKNFNARQAVADLQTQKAQQQLQTELLQLINNAKIQVVDPDKQPYVDAYLLEQLQQKQLMAQLGQPTSGPAPTKAEINALQNKENADFEALLKRNPNDPTAALMVAQNIEQNKLYAKGVTPAQQQAYRQQLIQLYQTALNNYEDRDLRFKLADLYAAQKDFTDAQKQYELIAKYLAEDPPYNSTTDQQYIGYYQRLANAFSALGLPDEAKKMQQQLALLKQQLAKDKAKEAAANKASSPLQGSVSLPPGGKATVPLNTNPAASKP